MNLFSRCSPTSGRDSKAPTRPDSRPFCLVIAKRAWARGSYLLMADEQDAAYEDEPEQPAEPESVS
jgi:endogenous inhibitor of DNA gyrase (YacG/DUF329 family)